MISGGVVPPPIPTLSGSDVSQRRVNIYSKDLSPNTTLCDIIVVTTFNIWRQNAVKIMNFKLTPSEAPPPPISMLDSEILLAQRRKGIILQHWRRGEGRDAVASALDISKSHPQILKKSNSKKVVTSNYVVECLNSTNICICCRSVGMPCMSVCLHLTLIWSEFQQSRRFYDL